MIITERIIEIVQENNGSCGTTSCPGFDDNTKRCGCFDKELETDEYCDIYYCCDICKMHVKLAKEKGGW